MTRTGASICIPTFNAARYLGEAIASALGQEWSPAEVLICDDASTDGTRDLVEAFRDTRVRYVRYENNAGQAGNFNRCLSLAQGEYWVLLSADDRLALEFLRVAIEALSTRPETGYFVAATAVIDPSGARTGEREPWPTSRPLPARETYERLLLGALFNLHCLAVRRSACDTVGSFRTDLSWGHDWDWILRLCRGFDGIYSARVLGDYREHGESGTEAILSTGMNGPQELPILRSALARLDPGRAAVKSEALWAFACRQLYFADRALRAGRPRAALASLRSAVEADRRVLTRPTFWRLRLACLGTRAT